MGKDFQSRMKVFHICSWYPNKVVINDGNFIHKHIRSTAQYVDSYVLAVYEDPSMKNGFEIDNEVVDGIPTLIIYHSKSNNKISKIIKRFYYYFKAYNILKQKFGNPDILHAHVMLYAGIFSWIISIKDRIQYIVTEHSTIYNSDSLPKSIQLILRYVAKRSKIILPVSKALQDRLEHFGILSEFMVIPNVVNTNIFKPDYKNNEVFEFLHISSFSEEKNIPGLFGAIKKLTLLRSDFHFTIAGDGDIKAVEKLKIDFQIEEKFLSLKGKLSENEVAEIMKNSNAFVLFSNDETFGIVIAESLSCGIPVITSNLPNITEFEKSNGLIIVEPKNEFQLIESMSLIIDNPLNINSNLLHDFCVENFSEGVIGKKLFEIYKSTIST